VGLVGPPCPPEPPQAVEATYSSEGMLYRLEPTEPPDSKLVFWFAGRPVATLATSQGIEEWRFLTVDHLGTPVVLTMLSGNVKWSGGFEPFGRDWQEGTPQGASESEVFLRLPGQWVDEAWQEASLGVDLYYNVFRWLEPGTGRYTRPDPLGLRGGMYLYAYAAGNPLVLSDPLGLKVFECCRDIEVNQFIDAASRTFGLKHCFIKTDTVEAGMGPANNGPLPACPIGVDTAIVAHTGQSTDPGTSCREIPWVDQNCVNQQLELGRRTGRWTPFNQCNSFTRDVFNTCRSCKTPSVLPPEVYPPCAGFGCPQNR
jgi:RHS repeat-associated protein